MALCVADLVGIISISNHSTEATIAFVVVRADFDTLLRPFTSALSYSKRVAAFVRRCKVPHLTLASAKSSVFSLSFLNIIFII